VISQRRFAALGLLCGTVVLAAAVGLAGLGSHIVERLAASMKAGAPTSVRGDARTVDATQATTSGEDGVDAAIGDVASRDSHPTLPTETATEQVAAEGKPDSLENDVKEETVDECSASDICVDQYLWSLYQRAPKVDTIRVPEQIEVKVKKKGKTRVVTKTVTKLVNEDFTWKGPKAAQKAGMSLVDYVIGGMDRSFKLRLYRALHALDDAGLSPAITSGFRDDYRQSLASGNKAAIDSSYHGGSRRGGHGHGLAVDLVSVKGETRAERFISSGKLWKWVDAHGREFGLGRPYLDKDPPHVAPIDGKEYADHRGGPNAQPAALETNKSRRLTTQDDHKTKKRAGAAKSSRVKSI
jgi:D-alanyl-D-alanine carboxypeptidase